MISPGKQISILTPGGENNLGFFSSLMFLLPDEEAVLCLWDFPQVIPTEVLVDDGIPASWWAL